MENSSKKRSRKSKLVARHDVDEDKNTEVQIISRNSVRWQDPKPGPSVQKPSTGLQFDIQIEVEECDDTSNSIPEIINDSSDNEFEALEKEIKIPEGATGIKKSGRKRKHTKKDEFDYSGDANDDEDSHINTLATFFSSSKVPKTDTSSNQLKVNPKNQQKTLIKHVFDDHDEIDNIDDKEEYYINALAKVLQKKKAPHCPPKETNKDLDQPTIVSQNDAVKASGAEDIVLWPSERTGPKNTEKNIVRQLKLDEQLILDMLEDISAQSTELVDEILAIEMRNMWGRVRHEIHKDTATDQKIQSLIEDWRVRVTSTGLRSKAPPVMYLCFPCEKAWWHLGPFREHAKLHCTDENYKFEVVYKHQESYIIGYLKSKPSMMFFPIESNCWQCGQNLQHHITFGRKSYSCKGCLQSFSSCGNWAHHQGQCLKSLLMYAEKHKMSEVKVFTCPVCSFKSLSMKFIENHLSDLHDVRSDVPTIATVKTCNLCTQRYSDFFSHNCPTKNSSYTCSFCCKRYCNRLLLYIHLKNNKDNYKCRICGITLRKQCMDVVHMVMHSKQFEIMYKCLSCTENILFLDEGSMKRHRIIWHKQKFDKRRTFCEMVLVPKELAREENLEKLDILTAMKVTYSKSVPFGELEVVNSVEDELQAIAALDEVATSTKNLQNELDRVEEPSINDVDHKCKEHHTCEEITTKPEISDQNEKQLVSTDASAGLNIVIQSATTVKEETISDDEEQVSAKSQIIDLKKIKSEETVKKEIIIEIEGEMDISNDNVDYREQINSQTIKKERISVEIEEHNIEESESVANDFCFNIKQEIEDIDIEVNNDDGYAGVVNKMLSTNEMNIEVKEENVDVEDLLEKVEAECNLQGDGDWLPSHMASHSGQEGKYNCSKCSSSFTTMRRYIVHLANHGVPKKTCPECDRLFRTYAGLSKHIRGRFRNLLIKRKIFRTTKYGDPVSSQRSQCRLCQEEVQESDMFRHWESRHVDYSRYVEMSVEGEDNSNSSSKRKATVDEKTDSTKEDSEEEEEKVEENEVDEKDLNDFKNNPLSPKVLKEAIAELLRKRKKVHHNCRICGRLPFNRRNEHKRHVIEHLLQDAYLRKHLHGALQCQICQQNFDKPLDYKFHMRHHGNLPVYECGLCAKTFSDCSNFTKHKKIHNINVHVCQLCHKKFQTKEKFLLHEQSHDKPIKCQCSIVFPSYSSYNRHQRMAHSKESLRYSCVICKERFKTIKEKWDHMWERHKERKHRADCPMCGQSFRKRGDVRTHLKTIKGKWDHMWERHKERKHRADCPMCGQSFRKRGDVRTHLKTIKEKWDHMWERHKERKHRADCPMCGQSFRKRGDVRTHLKDWHGLDLTHGFFISEYIKGNREPEGKQEDAVKTVLKTEKGDEITFLFST